MTAGFILQACCGVYKYTKKYHETLIPEVPRLALRFGGRGAALCGIWSVFSFVGHVVVQREYDYHVKAISGAAAHGIVQSHLQDLAWDRS
ncbi:hypothetical protein AQUCO_03700256v1 [Aquilegia coerulea]|uniref:Uncharacterized protein n=1 Tax=Aquilegia coerulea TaxID=218851 RepID=A0A2G5CUA3_AQUCA|nr:hypothetical protein AQUCO_03700256v1 [Aquilegia coerulea]